MIKEISELLSYDPATGIISNLVDRGVNAKAGGEAGYLHSSGYRYINILGKMRKAHRVAWALHYGCWPAGDIDHINGNRSDNRIGNLRSVSRKWNSQNRHAVNNRHGLPGVEKHGDVFRCCVFSRGKKYRESGFSSAEEAHKRYVQLKKEHHAGYASAKI